MTEETQKKKRPTVIQAIEELDEADRLLGLSLYFIGALTRDDDAEATGLMNDIVEWRKRNREDPAGELWECSCDGPFEGLYRNKLHPSTRDHCTVCGARRKEIDS
jgi:hypothetical protein